MTQPRFETGDSRNAWLNARVCVGAEPPSRRAMSGGAAIGAGRPGTVPSPPTPRS